MPRYTVQIEVNATNINVVKKQVAAAFPEQAWKVDKVDLNPSRADRLSEAEQQFDNAKSIIEELRDEMESWKDSIPENLQNGDKANEVQEALDQLSETYDNMEQVEFNVDFPSMF